MLRPAALAGLLALLPAAALAQGFGNASGYFGQNKVQYSTFDFQVIQTDHFDVHFYPRERAAALEAARMAERSYARLSRLLNHRFQERKVVILYASPTDFGQTNTNDVGEGTQGVTDFFKQRNVLYLQGAGAETEHVLTHEMVHQFQYDIFSRGHAGANLQALIQIAPPLWFMEGMAEYLSLGPVTPETALWLRDAVFTNTLPTIEQLTLDPRIFPYRYGHALWAYVGERWGDEAVGAILHGALTGGIESAVRRTLGLTLPQLSQQWRDEVFRRYLPEVGDRSAARLVGTPMLTKARSGGRLHLAPALSPDGTQVAYFSERGGFSVDMFLADAATGRVTRRLLKPTWSSNYETFRFLNSSASWSPDGKFLAFAGKRGRYDDLVILDVARNKEVRRVTFRFDGLTTPSWSPDGRQLVFTGYDGGNSDLWIVNADGSGLRRLTNDPYADLHPAWSPDGRTIAFTTDRGPGTDLAHLAFGNYRIALLDVETGAIEALPGMDAGKNINPVWAPDGKSFAFVSDRDGVSNIYLFDVGDRQVYQLTNLLTGSAGFSPLSPVLSWAHASDRLAFMYFDRGAYDVYALDDPRSLRGRPWHPAAPDSLRQVVRTVEPAAAPAAAPRPQVGEGGSIYRDRQGFRAADQVQRPTDSTPPAPPLSVVQLLDSTTLALPDTSEFTFRPYRKHYTPDFVARPQIGFVRDNFGNGVFGGTAVALSDVLGNHQLLFAGSVNGRLQEAYVQAVYANLSRRINWATGIGQVPYFYSETSEIRTTDNPSVNEFRTNIRRLVVRSAFINAWYPISRFQRLEAGFSAANVDDAILSIVEPYDVNTGFLVADPRLETDYLKGINYVQPSLALVYDNAIFGYTGPFRGQRYRFEGAQTLGGWGFTQVTADYRRYQRIAGPVTLAGRLLYFGRIGKQADQFRFYLGNPDILRGYTAGSFRRNECLSETIDPAQTETGCGALDQLVGTQIGVANVELRFPILTPEMHILPPAFPPIEGAVFYDMGVAWEPASVVKWNRAAGDDPIRVRVPLRAWGVSARMNVLGFVILRLDWSFPQKRSGVNSLVTLSIGPTF